jgi:methylmalonyl-CoA mutase
MTSCYRHLQKAFSYVWMRIRWLRKQNPDLKSTFEITHWNESEKFMLFHHTSYLSEIAESNRHWWNGFDPQVAQKIIWCFQNNRNSFRKSSRYHKIRNWWCLCIAHCYWIWKEGAVEDKIFLNLLLNQFDKMDLDPYNWNHINVEWKNK